METSRKETDAGRLLCWRARAGVMNKRRRRRRRDEDMVESY